MIEVRRDPSRREVAVFGGLWLVFWVAFGALVLWRPEVPGRLALVLGAAWIVSLLFHRAEWKQQLAGVALPAAFATTAAALAVGASPRGVAVAASVLGATGALLISIAPDLGRRIWIGWMVAAVPVGWTVSVIILATIYYLVLTPIGLVLRVAGYDPMHREFDPRAATYWCEREKDRPAASYFRQF